MTACSICTQTKTIPTCSVLLTLGQVSRPAIPMYVWVKNISSGYGPIRFPATPTNPLAILTVDLSTEPNFLTPHSTYELWVTYTDSQQREVIEIEGGEFTCFQLNFERETIEITGASTAPAAWTLQLDEAFTAATPFINLERPLDNTVVSVTSVHTWKNVGLGGDAIQGTPANQPALSGDEVVFTPSPALSEDFMVIPDFDYDTDYLYISALVFGNTSVDPGVIISHQTAAEDIIFDMYMDHSSGSIIATVGDGTNTKEYQINTDFRGTWHVFQTEFIGGTIDGSLTMWVDGVRYTHGFFSDDIVTALGTTSEPIDIGSQIATGRVDYLDANVKIVRVFSKVVSATQRQQETLEMLAQV